MFFPKHKWGDDTRINLKESGVYKRKWTEQAKGRGVLENPCVCCKEPSGSISHRVK